MVDRAPTQALPVFPIKRNDAAIGLGSGIVLGLALALFAETIDDTIRTSDDAESITGLPALAVIPHFDPTQKKVTAAAGTPAAEAELERMSRVSPDLISYTEPQSYVSEGFRTLRSSILLSAVDREPKLLLLTSSLPPRVKVPVRPTWPSLSHDVRHGSCLWIRTSARAPCT